LQCFFLEEEKCGKSTTRFLDGCVLHERELNYATPTSSIFHPSFFLGEILELLFLFALAMANRVKRGVCFIDTGLVPWLLLLSFSLSWDQVSKQQVGFLLKIPDATLVDRQRAYVPSFLQRAAPWMILMLCVCIYLIMSQNQIQQTKWR
jgi:hypothetical protein